MAVPAGLIKKLFHAAGLDITRRRSHNNAGAYAPLGTLGIRTVLDIGAHDGGFAREMAQLLPHARILSFEPLASAYAKLEHALPADRFAAFPFALGAETGPVTLYRSSYAQSSSLRPMAELHKQAFPESAASEPEVVECRRLDDVVALDTLEKNILIKVDVQGYEDRVIAGGRRAFEQAAAVIIEVSFEPLYNGQPLFDDVYRTLVQLGFRYAGHLYQLNHPATGIPLQADALFLRRQAFFPS